MKINEERFAAFAKAYEMNLHRAVVSHPDQYGAQPREAVERTVALMMEGLRAGTHNHDGRGFKWTCKDLGIKHARQAIKAYIEGE